MGTRYRYHTPAGGPPNDGIPPGTEAPQGAMFCPPYPFGGPPAFGGPLPFGGPQFGPPQCPPPQFGPSPFGPPPPPYGQQMCFPAPGPPPPGPGPMMCFPNQPPPPYAPNPWAQNPWGMPMPISGPSMPTKANERPPPGARVNGNVAKFGNQQGHIFSKNNTTFHLTLDGAKPWNWGAGGNHRFQVYTAASSMPIDEFIEQIGAIQKAPPGTPREHIGIQEAIEEGDGSWRAGVAIRLGDPSIARETENGTLEFKPLHLLGWSSQRGEVGRGKPVTIALLP